MIISDNQAPEKTAIGSGLYSTPRGAGKQDSGVRKPFSQLNNNQVEHAKRSTAAVGAEPKNSARQNNNKDLKQINVSQSATGLPTMNLQNYQSS
jgi:hypothetical protein